MKWACGKCKYFKERDKNDPAYEKDWDGFCLRNAPHPIVVEDTDDHEDNYVYWPRVFTRDNYCSEFAKAK